MLYAHGSSVVIELDRFVKRHFSRINNACFFAIAPNTVVSTHLQVYVENLIKLITSIHGESIVALNDFFCACQFAAFIVTKDDGYNIYE